MKLIRTKDIDDVTLELCKAKYDRKDGSKEMARLLNSILRRRNKKHGNRSN
ncbi:MAG TPA: hypothetical protein VN577_09955 [Terriglobales bacterium]|nr:hypothetical protein [Terriglobales bacterium]